MKISVNLIANIFLAILFSMVPYVAVIKNAVDFNLNMLYLVLPSMIATLITYVIAVIGLEKAEQTVKSKGEKPSISYKLYILFLGELLLSLIIGMVISLVGQELYIFHQYGIFSIIKYVIYYGIFIWVIIGFYKTDKISVLFLIPLLIYTIVKNKGKIKEINDILNGSNFECRVFPELEDVEETGTTFEENASIKSNFLSNKLKDEYVIADDSGLCVDYLNGQPGVYSARYAGIHGDDNANNKKLLKEMENVESRACKFVCVISLSKNGKTIKTFYGELCGHEDCIATWL